MFALAPHAASPPNHHAACSGCSLCLLVCPVWRATRNPRLTPEGRAKAMQNGAGAAELIAPIETCTLCGACEPVCPERIDLIDMILHLRAQLLCEAVPWRAAAQDLQARMHGAQAHAHAGASIAQARSVLLAGFALRQHPATLARAQALLACETAGDDGADIALALETGIAIPAARREQFLAPLRAAGTIVGADGLLLRELRRWLPRHTALSLGEALSARPEIRGRLRESDLYVIEPRAYHADYERLVKYYDRLRAETGCALSLDLQRIAVPATVRGLRQRLGLAAADDRGQTQWLLQGRGVERIVVEDADDIAALRRVSTVPVVQLADLADD